MWALDNRLCKDFINAMKEGVKPSFSDRKDFITEFSSNNAELPRIMAVAGDRATINIDGVLTDKPNWWAWYTVGNTTYSDIITSIALAENDPSVEEIIVNVSSGGGQASPMWLEAMNTLANAKKPVKAVVTFAASAAYGLASQADEILAVNSMAEFGSVGVVQSLFIDEEVVEITSTNARFKRVDPRTEEGKRVIQEELDQIESIFIDKIASGRGITAEEVIEKYGQGKVYAAEKALEVGAIDGIGSKVSNSNSSNSSASNEQSNDQEVEMKTLAELKQQHPDLYAQAIQAGVEQERDRVNTHIELGQEAGAMDKAIEFIQGGNELGVKENGAYTRAAIASLKNANRSDDNPVDMDASSFKPKDEPKSASDFEKQLLAAADAEWGSEDA